MPNRQPALAILALSALLVLPAQALQLKSPSPISPAPIGIDTSVMSTTTSLQGLPPLQYYIFHSPLIGQTYDFNAKLPPNKKINQQLQQQLDEISQNLHDYVAIRDYTLTTADAGASDAVAADAVASDPIASTNDALNQFLEQIRGRPPGLPNILPEDLKNELKVLPQQLQAEAQKSAGDGPVGLDVENGKIVVPYLFETALRVSSAYTFGPHSPAGQGEDFTTIPDVTVSSLSTGLDLNVRDFSGDLNGFGLGASYAFGRPYRHFQQALTSLAADPKTPIALNGQPLTLATLYNKHPGIVTKAQKDELQLRQALISETQGLQTTLYTNMTNVTHHGTYWINGGSVGEIVPVEQGGVQIIGAVQSLQFFPSDPSTGVYSQDVQGSLAAVLQDRIDHFRSAPVLQQQNLSADLSQSIVQSWHWKLGVQYTTKAFGGSNTLPADWLFFGRVKLYQGTKQNPLAVEVAAFYQSAANGIGGQPRQNSTTVQLALTLPLGLN